MQLQSRKQWVMAAAAIATCSILATPAALSAPTWPATTNTWQDVTDKPDTVHLVYRVSSSALHAVCTPTNCAFFLKPRNGCKPGAKYPLLINSASRVGVVPSRCIVALEEGKPQKMVHLQESTSLLAAMINEQNISIAFPAQAGSIVTLPIQMQGAGELLTNGMQKMNPAAANAATPNSNDSASRHRASPRQGTRTRRAASRYQV